MRPRGRPVAAHAAHALRPLSTARKVGFGCVTTALLLVSAAGAGELVLRRLAAAEHPGRVAWYQERWAAVSPELPSLRPGHYVPTPGSRRPYRPDIGDWGFRDRVPAVPKPPGVVRVIVIGDSVAFGAGVDDPAAVAPKLLERRLRAERSPSYEVLNLGVPGYNALQLLHLVRDLVLPELEPDLVLYLHYKNDSFDNRFVDWLFHDKLGFRIRPRDVGIHRGWYQRAAFLVRSRGHLVAFLEDRLLALKYRWRGRALERAGGKVGASTAAGPTFELLDPLVVVDERDTFALYAIEEMAARATARGVPFVVFGVPQLEQPRRRDAVFLTQLAALVPHVHGLASATRGYTPAELTVSEVDTHPSALGHRVLADAMLDILDREHLLPPPGARSARP